MRPPASRPTDDPSVTIKRMKTHELGKAKRDILEENEKRLITQAILKDQEAISALIDDPENDPTRIRFPERIFRENFLPVITGEAQTKLPPGVTSEAIEQQARQKWLAVSRGNLNEVDVVDDDNKVVFTMPALFPTGNFHTLQDREGGSAPLKVYAKDYRDHLQTLPTVGMQKLKFGLDQHLERMFANGEDNTVKEKINKMLDYYGIDLGNKPAQGAQAQADDGGLGEMFYD